MSRKKKKKRSAAEPAAASHACSADRDSIYVWADNLLFSCALLILFLRPFVSGRTYPTYNHFFNAGVALLTILWLVKCYRKGTLDLHNRLVTGFALAFLVVCSLTFFTTVSKGITLRYIYEILSYTLLFLVIANNFRETASIKIGVATILAAALLVTLYGLYQRYYSLEMTRRYVEAVMQSGRQEMLLGVPLGPGILHRLESPRVFSTFIYANAYAIYLVFVGSLTVGWMWSMGSRMKKLARDSTEHLFGSSATSVGDRIGNCLRGIGGLSLLLLFLLSCVLIPWNLWLTYSRGGWACACVVVLVLIAAGFRMRRRVRVEKVAALVLLAALAVAMLTAANAICAEMVPMREISFSERLHDMLSVSQRVSYWRGALAMIRDNPWLGVGWGAFQKAYPRYMVLGGHPVKLAHNNYLQVWAETGIVGLNAFVGLWLVFFYTFWRKLRDVAEDNMRGIVCGLGAGIIGFLAHSYRDDDKFSFRLPRPAAAAIIVLLCVYLWFLYRSFACLSLVNRVSAERNEAFPTAYARDRGFKPDPEKQRRVLRNGIRPLNRAIGYFRLDSTSYHLLGDTYFRLARMEDAASLLNDAVEQFERAAALDPLSPYVFQSLATAYWDIGIKTGEADMFRQALSAEQRASQNFPVNPEYHKYLSQIYRALGQEEKAKEEDELAAELAKHYKIF
jgi:putative inorganic carbon (HCO3(-)) transporter